MATLERSLFRPEQAQKICRKMLFDAISAT